MIQTLHSLIALRFELTGTWHGCACWMFVMAWLLLGASPTSAQNWEVTEGGGGVYLSYIVPKACLLPAQAQTKEKFDCLSVYLTCGDESEINFAASPGFKSSSSKPELLLALLAGQVMSVSIEARVCGKNECEDRASDDVISYLHRGDLSQV